MQGSKNFTSRAVERVKLANFITFYVILAFQDIEFEDFCLILQRDLKKSRLYLLNFPTTNLHLEQGLNEQYYYLKEVRLSGVGFPLGNRGSARPVVGMVVCAASVFTGFAGCQQSRNSINE